MRSKLRIAIPVAVLAAVGVFLAPSASGQTVLHVVMPQEGLRTVFDTRRDGLRFGDRVTARGPLVDETQTERLGTGFLQCLVHRRIVDRNRGLWNCNYVLELADGDIVLQGLDPRGPGVYEVSVLGGTDSYAGGTGDATFTDVVTDDNAYTDIVIRLKK